MDYLEILKDINYLSFVTSFAKWILLFFAISILVLIIGHKFKFFKRQRKVARIIVKLYYILIPIYFIFFAIKFAPVRNMQNEMNHVIDSKEEVLKEFAFGFLRTVVKDSLLHKKSSREIVDSYLAEYNQQTDSIVNASIPDMWKRLIKKVKMKVEFVFLKRLIELKIVSETSKLIGVQEDTGKVIYDSTLNDLFKEGEIVQLFKDELNHYFGQYYKFLLLTFLIGLIIPTIEIILAKKLKY